MTDNISELKKRLSSSKDNTSPEPVGDYQTCHKLLAEDDFVLSACAGISRSKSYFIL